MHKRIVNTKTVQQELKNDQWRVDCEVDHSYLALVQQMHLSQAIATVECDPSRPDKFSWPCSQSGVYTAKSLYNNLFINFEKSNTAACTWRSWAPLKCKLFVWLAPQHRLWTSDRRARHRLDEQPSSCFLYLQEEDNIEHILGGCTYAWDDEDINTIVTPQAPAAIHTGQITRARARQLNYQILSFLGNDSNVPENMMLPKLGTFVLLTNEGPNLDTKDEPWSKFKHGDDGMRKGNKNRVTSDDSRTSNPP